MTGNARLTFDNKTVYCRLYDSRNR